MAKNNKDEQKNVPLGVSYGTVGTEIYDGIIQNDYEKNWRDLDTRLKTIEQMKKGDATAAAMLDTVKSPLLSAKWYIEAGGTEPEYEQHADFASKVFFEDLKGGFTAHLIEAVTCLENGFSLFEKIYDKDADGRIIFSRFQPLLQSSIETWGIKGEPWVDGHPAGITQIVYGTDENENKGVIRPTIPWNKLLRFSFRATGNNFEGQSILRPAYKHWFFKEALYKISNMAAERFGVGVPFIKFKKDPSDKQRELSEQMLANIRSNAKAYAVFGESMEIFDILIPKNSGNLSIIQDAIKDHDQKMYDAILAGFLKLASGDGGSFALSRDQSSFFLRAEQWIANFLCSVWDTAIQELIWLNFGTQKVYPKMKTSDLGQVSLDEYINALALARNSGLISWGDQDEAKTREQLKLPSLIKVQGNVAPRVDPKPQEQGSQVNMPNSEKRAYSLAGTAKPSQREERFMKNIADFENYLNAQYTRVDKMVSDIEDKIRVGLKDIYEASDTERVDGRLVLARTPKNKEMRNRAVDLLKTQVKKVNRLIFKNANNGDAAFMRDLFSKARSMAMSALEEDEKLFSDIFIDEQKFNAFMKGYRSNVDALLFNDPRRVEENIIQNYGSQVSVELALSQLDNPIFNRNILKLSVLSHPRGAYNGAQFDINNARGFTLYKVLAPKSVLKSLDPAGMTARLIFGIYTIGQFNKKVSEMTEGRTSEAVNGLGTHHNAVNYFFPIASDELDQEEAVAKEQRSKLKEYLS